MRSHLHAFTSVACIDTGKRESVAGTHRSWWSHVGPYSVSNFPFRPALSIPGALGTVPSTGTRQTPGKVCGCMEKVNLCNLLLCSFCSLARSLGLSLSLPLLSQQVEESPGAASLLLRDFCQNAVETTSLHALQERGFDAGSPSCGVWRTCVLAQQLPTSLKQQAGLGPGFGP